MIFWTVSLEWTELSVTGALPPPRCGHTATMVEKRLLVYGGRGDITQTILPWKLGSVAEFFLCSP